MRKEYSKIPEYSEFLTTICKNFSKLEKQKSSESGVGVRESLAFLRGSQETVWKCGKSEDFQNRLKRKKMKETEKVLGKLENKKY